MVKFLDLVYQYNNIKKDIDDAISNVIKDAAFINGKYAKMFEDQFAIFCNAKHCVGVGNGTDALEIAIEALDLPRGSEIIVPANSFIASSEAVSRQGFKIRFVNFDPKNYTICINDLIKKINNKTSAIILVHLYGHPCDIDKIKKITKNYNIKLIEDCAQAHGALYKNKKVGTLGDVACFSFYPGKNLGAYGDAGAIVTNNSNVAIHSRKIANHGRIEKYDHEFEGRNSRIDGIQAAILSVKLKHLESWTSRRIEQAKIYDEKLSSLNDIKLPKKNKWAKHVYHLYVIQINKRDELREYLSKEGIQTGIHYPTLLPNLLAYKTFEKKNIAFHKNDIGSKLLSLPIGDHLNKFDIELVCSKIKCFLRK